MTLANKHTMTTTSNRTATPLSKYNIAFELAAKTVDSGVLVEAPTQIDISRFLAGTGKG
jgi:hypothetical protein